ncbi:hypothetical protein CEUSTIGMA_g5079.t1 [Chlamydomonas eustigma]|uniref:Uncharacterized protein n=1 Tax=Chlamydomonas eustigma TaxID=1157962 RepID=A0A250X3K3_9CHLO|nr:hypothetical protein CEUSTIGMA_g5079.t1 [Chlamydomonas eustigma]|eukprot:GAX77636.1 hypothetical protein CEUSTIGMA_g5079.t1 [Chlamydomonas eustigma]
MWTLSNTKGCPFRLSQCTRQASSIQRSSRWQQGRYSTLTRCKQDAALSIAQPTPPAVKAALFTGSYASVAGCALTFFPTQTFGLLFNLQEVTSGWIRVGGILFTLIGLQYLGAALGDIMAIAITAKSVEAAEAAETNPRLSYSFYEATVWSRLLLAAGFSVVVAVGEAPLSLLVLAAINVVGALSMAMALKKTPRC